MLKSSAGSTEPAGYFGDRKTGMKTFKDDLIKEINSINHKKPVFTGFLYFQGFIEKE